MKTTNHQPHYKLAFSALLFSLLSLQMFGQEICNNGIDDDGDGLIDLNDFEDCFCEASSTLLDIIPNPSFEENTCCPDDLSETFSIPCLNSWLPGNFGTPDYLNTCGFTTEALPLPLPDGDGVIGFGVAFLEDIFIGEEILLLEYVGACLTDPLVAGGEYTLDLSIASAKINELGESFPIDFGPLNLTIYGVTDCNFPVGNDECPEFFGWENIGSIEYSPSNEWEQVSIQLETNQDYAGLAIGSNCELDDSYIFSIEEFLNAYFFLDNLELFEGGTTQAPQLTLTYSDCNEAATVQTSEDAPSYQWYFEGVAIEGEIGDELFIELDGNLNDGTYGLVVTDLVGNCTFQDVQVEGLTNELIIGSDLTTGCPPLTVNFDANLASGDQPLSWTIGDELIEGLSFELTFDEPGVFPVSAQFTDINGCVFSAEADPIVVSDESQLNPTFDVLAGCAPFNIALGVEESVSGCIWTLADGEVISNECDFIYEYDGSVDFTVEVESTNSDVQCVLSGSTTIPITQAQVGAYSITGDFEFCEGDSTVVNGFPETNTYAWNGSQVGNSFIVTQSGDYSVVITEPDGCEYNDSFTVTAINGPSFDPPASIDGCLGESVDLSEFTNADDISFTVPAGEDLEGFQGLVTVSASNQCGIIEREVFFNLEDCSCRVYIPNAFTPDGDGVNDLFSPQINCALSEYEFVIFNRWGEEVFSTKNPSLGWNGASGDKDFFTQTSIYTYVVRYDGEENRLTDPVELVGSVTVIR